MQGPHTLNTASSQRHRALVWYISHPLFLAQMAEVATVYRMGDISHIMATIAPILDKVQQVRSFVNKTTSFSPSHFMACQGLPFRQPTFRPPTHRRLATTLTRQLVDQMPACPQRYGCPHLRHHHQRPTSNRIRRSMPQRCREIPPLLGIVYLLPSPRSRPRIYRASRTHPGLPKPAFVKTPPPCTAIFSQIASLHPEPMARALSLLPSSRAHLTCNQRRYHQQTLANVTRNSSRRTIRLQHKCGRCIPEPRPTYRTRSVWRI